MESMEEIKKSALNSMEKAADEEALKLLKIKYLGRSGKLTMVLRGLKDIPEERRKVVGAKANALRQELEYTLLGLEQTSGKDRAPRWKWSKTKIKYRRALSE